MTEWILLSQQASRKDVGRRPVRLSTTVAYRHHQLQPATPHAIEQEQKQEGAKTKPIEAAPQTHTLSLCCCCCLLLSLISITYYTCHESHHYYCFVVVGKQLTKKQLLLSRRCHLTAIVHHSRLPTYVCAFSVAFDKASVCLVPSLSPVDANMQSLLTTRMQHTQTLQWSRLCLINNIILYY